MMSFEDVLEKYDPMISASMRKLNIYRDHEQFRQAGRVALWQAWTRFDAERGSFTPFAYRSIWGGMLDELKKENRFEENVVQMEDEILAYINEMPAPVESEWADFLVLALDRLTATERELVQWLFVDGLSLAECAERFGISVAGIKKRRERMLVKLRGELTGFTG